MERLQPRSPRLLGERSTASRLKPLPQCRSYMSISAKQASIRLLEPGVDLQRWTAPRLSSSCDTRLAPGSPWTPTGSSGTRRSPAAPNCSPAQPRFLQVADSLGDALLGLVQHDLLQPLVALGRQSRIRRNAPGCTCRLQGPRPGRPDRRTQSKITIQRRVFAFDTLAVQQAVLRLFHRRQLEVQRARDAPPRRGLGARVLSAGAPVQHPALPHQSIHRDDLGHRHFPRSAMQK